MKITGTILAVAVFALLAVILFPCLGLSGHWLTGKYREPSGNDSSNRNEIADTSSVKGYMIGNYLLFPEPRKIWSLRIYGTETKDCVGYVPDSLLKYGEHPLVICGGMVFFDTFDLDIDWETVRLLGGNEYAFEFTDEEFWYLFNGATVYKYDRNIPDPIEKEAAKQSSEGKNVLAGSFRVKGHVLYFDDLPVLEPFDVKSLHRIRSASGFETDFITDGQRVLYARSYSCCIEEKNGKEFASIKNLLIEGVDFASLRVLGKNILADKNALYYETSVSPFAELKGLKLILREQ